MKIWFYNDATGCKSLTNHKVGNGVSGTVVGLGHTPQLRQKPHEVLTLWISTMLVQAVLMPGQQRQAQATIPTPAQIMEQALVPLTLEQALVHVINF